MRTEELIAAERRALHLKPWQFAPSEVRDEPNPYPPGCTGYDSWNVAAQQWRELQARRAKP